LQFEFVRVEHEMGHKQYQLKPISDTTEIEGQAATTPRKPRVWQHSNDWMETQ